MNLSIEEGHFKGFDNVELYYQTWAKPNPKAILIGVHGLGEHADSYKLLAEGLQNSPFQLVMPDLRGHGRSYGKRGVGTIDQFVLDMKLFALVVQKRFSGLPTFFVAHSMGALVTSKLFIRHGFLGTKGAVFSSPLMGVAVDIPAIKRKSAGFLSALTPNLTLHNEISFQDLSHNPQHIDSLENDNLRHDRISPRLFVDMLASIDYVLKQADKIQGPIFIQQAGIDRIVSRPAAEEFFSRLTTPDKKLRVYENFFHEIYNESQRQEPIGDLIRWVEEHL